MSLDETLARLRGKHDTDGLYSQERAVALLQASYRKLDAAVEGIPPERWPAVDWAGVDAACDAKDWPALRAAVGEVGTAFLEGLRDLEGCVAQRPDAPEHVH